jgi:hypothetical protein
VWGGGAISHAGKKLKERDNVENQGIDQRLILKFGILEIVEVDK